MTPPGSDLANQKKTRRTSLSRGGGLAWYEVSLSYASLCRGCIRLRLLSASFMSCELSFQLTLSHHNGAMDS